MDESNKRKVLFKNVSNNLVLEEISLVLENKRYVGASNIIIKRGKEYNHDRSKRDIIFEFESEECVQKLLKIRKITYKEFELIPLLPDSEQLMKKEKTITYVYTDTYKYPFYLLTLNKEFLRNFKDELNKIDAKINQMDKNNIVIEKLIRHYDDKLNLDFPKFIDYFEKKYFSKLEIKNIDDNLWPKTRSKAIDLCKQNDRVSLIYRNKPENYLRIDGEIKAIEEVSKNLNCFLKEQNI